MFHSMTVFCSFCGQFTQLNKDGACPHCSNFCEPYEGLTTACQDFQQKIDSLFQKNFAFYLGTLSLRAEYEQDEVWMELRPQIEEKLLNLGDMSFHLLSRLPKLDVASIEFCHEYGERVAIYFDGYSTPFYHTHYKGLEIPFFDAVHGYLNKPVFPDAHENGMSRLCYHHLVPALYLCLTWNRLWYAALADGFFLLPDISDLSASSAS